MYILNSVSFTWV